MFLSKNLTLFTVANVIFYLVCISSCNSSSIDSAEPGCDCGPHSLGCEFQNDTLVCKCNYKYRQEGENCTAYCEKYYQCNNDAPCVNESCQCHPGTSGDFCDIVDECEGIKGPLMCGDPKDVLCMYDSKTQKPYCNCRIFDYIYYPPIRKCVECDCGKYGSCTLVNGKKTCKCNEGAVIRKVKFFGEIVDRCDVCNCGNNSDGCSFEGLYEKICNCTNGTAQQPDLYGEACNECNCGPHGQCYFKAWYQHCNCDEGYKAFLNLNRTKLTCEACDCGRNGVCFFEEEVQQCKCNLGYAVRNGKCTACQCYADDKPVDCTFTNEIQNCLCPDGYTAGKFICNDIDECANGNNSCPRSTTCENTMGSYECMCKEGYTPRSDGINPKTYGCEDIDECKDAVLCPPKHTVCTNYVGSYSCVCEGGYVPVHPNTSPKVAGCEKKMNEESNGSGWTTALIVMGVALCVCAAGAILLILKQGNTSRRELGMDTPFQQMKT